MAFSGSLPQITLGVEVLSEGDARNRWRDGPVCPAVDKELGRLGPDGSGHKEKKDRKKIWRERVREKRPGEREKGKKTGKNLERESKREETRREREKEKKTGEKKSPRESEKDDERRWR
ncbi:hypothetical protein TNCV_227311 [Trichonephila clavipes]|nr:hypothetical protein TNCV_227311 [Trichonephila clavipes]